MDEGEDAHPHRPDVRWLWFVPTILHNRALRRREARCAFTVEKPGSISDVAPRNGEVCEFYLTVFAVEQNIV